MSIDDSFKLSFQECEGHEGAKAQRVVFCHKDECLFSTGFSRMSERQYALWHIQMGVSRQYSKYFM